jgi:hypothetical protein
MDKPELTQKEKDILFMYNWRDTTVPDTKKYDIKYSNHYIASHQNLRLRCKGNRA